MKDLIERLRNSRDCDELCDEAADAIEKLEADLAQAVGEMEDQGPYINKLRDENTALKASVREYGDAIERLSADREESLKDKVALAMEIEALKAELAAMLEQKPVAYRFTENRGNGNTEFNYYGLDEVGMAYRDNCLKITALYAAPGAKP